MDKITSCSGIWKSSLKNITDPLKSDCEKAGKPLTGGATLVSAYSLSLLALTAIFIF
jgi:hypothetical protein